MGEGGEEEGKSGLLEFLSRANDLNSGASVTTKITHSTSLDPSKVQA